jgi:hypothetical protein
MRVLVTTTKILKPGGTAGRDQAGDRHIEGSELDLYSGEGALLAILDRRSGTIYQTDFAYAGVAAVLAAAPVTGGHFLLT